jgi:hypothetical protein
MLLPGDEGGPHWLPVSLNDPGTFDSVLLTLVSQSPDGTLVVVGNAFIIYANNHDALCLTAAHNFEFIKSLQKNGSLQSHPTLPRDFQFRGTQYIKSDGCTALWTARGQPYICKVVSINYIQNYDVAVFSAHSDDTAPVFSGHAALNVRMPKIGDRISCLGHKLDFKQTSDENGILERRLICCLGTVTDDPVEADRMGQMFSFETTIPIPPGLSGAPIIATPENGKTLTACGVVSFDFSSSDAFISKQIAGQSRAAALWPSAGLGFAMNVESKGPAPTLLADLIRGKFVETQSPGIEISADASEGKVQILYRDMAIKPPRVVSLETTGHPLYVGVQGLET